MYTSCPQPDDEQVQVGRSIGIGLIIGCVCGGIVIFLFVIAYRFGCLRSLIAKTKGLDSTGSKNKTKLASNTYKQSQEGKQQHQKRSGDKKSMKQRNIDPGFSNKNVHTVEETNNVPQNKYQETDRSSYVRFEAHTPYYQQNDEEPTYENVATMAGNEDEYDYVAPYTVQGWYPAEPQSDEGYVYMKSSDHSRWGHHGQK